jgi:hypothetical protein
MVLEQTKESIILKSCSKLGLVYPFFSTRKVSIRAVPIVTQSPVDPVEYLESRHNDDCEWA